MSPFAIFAFIALSTLSPCVVLSGVMGLPRNPSNSAGGEEGLEPRTVWDPRITAPKRGTVWKPHSRVNVTWDIHSIPKGANRKGMLLLGWQSHPGGSEHLDLDHPLNNDVNLYKGTVEIAVPAVPPRDNYIVALLGDSGNISPPFIIL